MSAVFYTKEILKNIIVCYYIFHNFISEFKFIFRYAKKKIAFMFRKEVDVLFSSFIKSSNSYLQINVEENVPYHRSSTCKRSEKSIVFVF